MPGYRPSTAAQRISRPTCHRTYDIDANQPRAVGHRRGVMAYGAGNVTTLLLAHGTPVATHGSCRGNGRSRPRVPCGADRVLHMYGRSCGWLTVLRWTTGHDLGVDIAGNALRRDWVGVESTPAARSSLSSSPRPPRHSAPLFAAVTADMEATLAKAQEPHSQTDRSPAPAASMLVLRPRVRPQREAVVDELVREYSATRTGRPTTQP